MISSISMRSSGFEAKSPGGTCMVDRNFCKIIAALGYKRFDHLALRSRIAAASAPLCEGSARRAGAISQI